MKKLIISPIFNQYMSGRVWFGLDTAKLGDIWNEEYGYSVGQIPFSLLLDELDRLPQNVIIFYSSFYNLSYLQFIKDTIEIISRFRPDITLIPSRDTLLNFENKGFQEYYKKYLGIEQVEGKYYGDFEDFENDPNRMDFPFIFKTLTGATSSGVHLIKNQKSLDKLKKNALKVSFREMIGFKLNKRKTFQKYEKWKPVKHIADINFNTFYKKRHSFIIQKFIPSLDCDYRITIFGNRYFAMQRVVREGDFRASGSGKNQYIIPPTEVLNYAKNIYEKLKVPFNSIDIGIDKDKNCYLFEFQGTAFGPVNITLNDKYFILNDGKWEAVFGKYDLEEQYCYAVDYFVKYIADNENP